MGMFLLVPSRFGIKQVILNLSKSKKDFCPVPGQLLCIGQGVKED